MLLVLFPLIAVLKEERWPFAVLGLIGLLPAVWAVVLTVSTISDLLSGAAPFAQHPMAQADTITSGLPDSPAHLLFGSTLTVGWWVAMCFAALARESSGR